MITWIQIALQKHHKFVFSILLVVITIAFVFTIGQIPFFGDRNMHETTKKDFYGFDLSNQNTLSYLELFAAYDAILMGAQPTEAFIYRQAFLRDAAKKLGITHVNESDFVAYIHSAPLFAGVDGKFDASVWKRFVDSRVASGRFTEESLTSVLAENAMLAKVEKLLGGPGYFFKGEVAREYDQMFGKWTFELATLSFDKFNPEIKPDAKALETFYNENSARFRVGEGVVLETVFLPVAEFAAKVAAPAEADLRAYYNANIAKYSEMKDGTPKTAAFEAVKTKVRGDYLTDAAARAAVSRGEDIALKIYNSKAAKNSPELKKLLAGEKLVSKKSKAMRSTDREFDKSLPAKVVETGFKLDEQNFYSDPMLVEDGVWIVFLAEKLAAFQPKLSDVKAEVEKVYKQAEKRRLFSALGKKLDADIESGMKSGKTFEAVAKADGAKVETVKNFSFENPSTASDAVKAAFPVIASTLPSLKDGEVSKVQISGENGYAVRLVSFVKPQADAKKIENIQKNYSAGMAAASVRSILVNVISQGETQNK